ncbi:MAG TPA: DUF2834 domain-containing protein [Vicinamibacterales bacterium]|jgi:hypothetical protein
MKWIYAGLCVLGVALPYCVFRPFVAAHGLDILLLVQQSFASPVAAFFAADVIVSSLVLWAFIFHETRKRPIRFWWVCIVANLAAGVSLGFPLFLLLREIGPAKQNGVP